MKWGQHSKFCNVIMKTQISDLVSGVKDIRRDLSHPKYANAPQATSHVGYGGTNSKIRQEIAEKVLSEHPDGMDIEMCSKRFHLDRSSSLSGKTVWFSTEIDSGDFLLLSGYKVVPFSNERSFTLLLNSDMTIEIQMSSRPNNRCQWKYRGCARIGEEFVTIL